MSRVIHRSAPGHCSHGNWAPALCPYEHRDRSLLGCPRSQRVWALLLALAAWGVGATPPAASLVESSGALAADRPPTIAKRGGSTGGAPLCERLGASAGSLVAAAEPIPKPGAAGTAALGASVDIPDAALRKAVEEALGKAPGEAISRGEMAALRALSSESGVRQLAGIEFAVNLRELCLVRGAISDLAPLAGIASLERLYLYLRNRGPVALERPLVVDDP